MAQSMFQDMVNKMGLAGRFEIDSAATSREEIGNGPHYGTVSKLRSVGIPVVPHGGDCAGLLCAVLLAVVRPDAATHQRAGQDRVVGDTVRSG